METIRTLPLYVSSTSNNAYHVDLTTGSMNFRMDNSINLRNDEEVHISLQDAEITNFFPNIITASGLDTLYYTNSATPGDEKDFKIEFPEGYYDITSLNAVLEAGFLANTHAVDLFEFYGVNSTQKIQIRFNYAGWKCFFATADTPWALLGATADLEVPSSALSTAVTYFTLPNQAELASLISIHWHCNLLASANYNDRTNDVLANIQVNVAPGSVINFLPTNPLKLHSASLTGATISNFRIYLTDESGDAINLGGQNFAGTIVLFARQKSKLL